MKAQLLTMSTPDGPFTIIARDGAVLSSGWTAVPGELTGQIHAALLPAGFETFWGSIEPGALRGGVVQPDTAKRVAVAA